MIKDIKTQNETVLPSDRVMEKLHADFPQCFTNEGKFDLEKFKTLLNDKVDVAEEGYDLNFLGKNYANLIASTETETVLQPDLEHNSKLENKDSQNIYISGDNLDALKHLLKSYAGKIKCIYIDPPYNTGSDGFVYNDKFNFTVEQLQTKLGIGEEKAKRILDLCKRGSASHSAWLMFMAPRLMLARDLLTEDGVIFISIDDNEQANLKLLCDGVFGEENFLANISVIVKTEGRRYGCFAKTHEYLISYSCDLTELSLNEIEVEGAEFRYMDSLGGFNLTDLRNQNARAFNSINRPNLRYPFYVDEHNPDENGFCNVSTDYIDGYKEVFAITVNGNESVWRWGKEKARIENHNLVSRKSDDGEFRIYQKYRKLTQTAKTVWSEIDFISNKGTKELQDLLGIGVFDFPKPLGLISQTLSIGTNDSDIILDFFSGSATTAHAVMKLNSEDDGNRKFIMVQLPEQTPADSEARKAGYQTIDQIGQERIHRAAAKIKAEKPDANIDFGFKHFTLQDVPQNTLDKMETFDPQGMFGDTDILKSFGEETVLATWMVKDGYGLTQNAEPLQLADYTAYYCDSHIYLIDGEGFDEKAMIALVDKYGREPEFNPNNVVLFGYSFNFTQTEMLKKNLSAVKKLNERINIDIRY